ncbi:MAG TPA: hypothetical protein VKS22_13210 [Candidatus Binataceae bacterium]|nr:hypothetical protein [Candidatus Binataceae bacterium]
MGEDIALSIAKSGIKDLLLGGKEGSFGAALFGKEGAGGGLAGIGASIFGGPAATGAVNKLFGDAFKAAEPAVKSLFGEAFKGLGNVVGNLAGGSAAAGAGNAAQNAAKAAAAQGEAMNNALQGILGPLGKILQTAMTLALIPLHAISAAHLATAVSHFALAELHLAQALIHTTLLTLIALFSSPAGVKPFGFASGGIVPSAAGGMTVGNSGTFAILHPREMVLPAHLSERVQRAFPRGGEEGAGGAGGGHTFVNHFHIEATDGDSVARLLMNNRGALVNALRGAIRGAMLEVPA